MTHINRTAQDKLKALRDLMDRESLDGYIVPRTDEYQGEFVAPYADRLKWLTGFTGSAGAAVILKDRAVVMSDGRYTLQLRGQVDAALYGTADYTKKKIGEWIAENTHEGAVIGYDPMLMTNAQVQAIEKPLSDKAITLNPAPQNLVDAIWENRPEKPDGSVDLFPAGIAGMSALDKLGVIRQTLEKQGVVGTALNLPDSIAWLLNIRGRDMDHLRQALSTLIVYTGDGPAEWFINPAKVPDDVRESFGNHLVIYKPQDLQERLRELAWKAQSLSLPAAIDYAHTPVWFKTELEEAGAKLKDVKDPCILPKALKTAAEQTAIRTAHIHDGAALVKFLHWLDTRALAEGADEIAVDEKLQAFRRESPAYVEPSFPTIAGFGPNGAIIHYRAEEKTARTLEEGSLLLLDSGGQYLGDDFAGTTDITRTIAIGAPSAEMKTRFTLVLKGHIALASARFPEGATGAQIDAFARAPLWAEGLDYAHGTGHGVGCFLGVHEEAANISPRGTDPLQPGMLLSNEPGYYKEEAYGIRIENLVFVQSGGLCDGTGKTMLHFETISYAPIDSTLIVPDLLSAKELTWLNDYHAKCLEILSPLVNDEQKNWLKEKTRPLA